MRGGLSKSAFVRMTLGGFILGIGVYTWMLQSEVSFLFFFGVGGSAVLGLRFWRKWSWLFLIVGFLGYSLGGAVGFWDFSKEVEIQEGYQVIEGVILKAEEGESSQKIVVASTNSEIGKTLVFIPLYPELHRGQEIRYSCKLEHPEPFDGFAYDQYLASKDIFSTCFSQNAPVVLENQSLSWPWNWVEKWRFSLKQEIEQAFQFPQSTLLKGLLFGEQSFSSVWEERFQQTGTTHIIAASGYNVSLVSILLYTFLISIGLWRKQTYPLVLVGIAIYAVMAGMDAPILRASIMGALVITARQIGRKTTMTNIFLVTMAVMLFQEPKLLLFDVGFQLSVVSTAALLFLSKGAEEWFKPIPEVFGIRESFSATIVATLATIPVILQSFSGLSLIAPLVNVMVLPLVPYAMAFGGIAMVVHLISPFVSLVFIAPAWLFLELILDIIRSFSTLPFSYVMIPEMVQWVVSIGALYLMSLLWKRTQNQ